MARCPIREMNRDFGRQSSSMGIRKSIKSCDTPAPTNNDLLRDLPALEFPDWNGILPHRNHKTFELAGPWNKEMLTLFPPKKLSSKLEMKRRCRAEFVL